MTTFTAGLITGLIVGLFIGTAFGVMLMGRLWAREREARE